MGERFWSKRSSRPGATAGLRRAWCRRACGRCWSWAGIPCGNRRREDSSAEV